MASKGVYDTYIPSTGDPNADIMVVGEAGGRKEQERGEPFVGKSGRLMTRYFERNGVPRDELFLTNLSKYRPKRNKFEKLLKTVELEKGLNELREEILSVEPNVIVACGNWPLYYLTGKTGKTGKKGTGITNWRGSVLPCTLVPGHKVLATYHPAYIIRPTGYRWNPIFHHDLSRAVEESAYSDIRYPEYESFIDPPRSEAELLAGEMMEAEFLSVDIETMPEGQLSCIGFTDSTDRGLTLTYERPGNWDLAQDLLLSDAKKIFQWGHGYDIPWLWHFKRWEVRNYYWDTFVGAMQVMPEFPRGLDFLTSVYTRFPFYKEERKEWKETGDMSVLWEYNIKDVVVTLTIALKQMEEIENLYGPVPFEEVQIAREAA